MPERSGKSAKLKITAVNPTSSTGEAMTLTQSTGTEFVQINDTGKRHWDRNVSTGFALYLNSTAVSESDYDINFVQGKFEFRSTGTTTGTYTADVEYLTASYLGKGQSWEFNVDTDMNEDTSFSTSTADVQWRTFEPGLSGWSGTIERLVSTGTTSAPEFFDRLNLPVDVITEFVTHDFNRFEGYGRIQSINNSAPVDGLLAESVNLSGDGPIYLSSS